jgi:hypothetical protein
MINLIPTIVYFLCFGTSACCATLLVRSYLRTRSTLLLWTAICFVLLGVNNLLVVADLVFLPDSIDLRPARLVAALAGLSVLLYGFIWELD